MKTIYALIVFLLIATSAQAGWYRDINTSIERSGKDYVIHMVGGSLVSSTTYSLLPDQWDNSTKVIVSTLATSVFTYGVESLDQHPDMQGDGLEWILSGFGTALFRAFVNEDVFDAEVGIKYINGTYGMFLTWSF